MAWSGLEPESSRYERDVLTVRRPCIKLDSAFVLKTFGVPNYV